MSRVLQRALGMHLSVPCPPDLQGVGNPEFALKISLEKINEKCSFYIAEQWCLWETEQSGGASRVRRDVGLRGKCKRPNE